MTPYLLSSKKQGSACSLGYLANNENEIFMLRVVYVSSIWPFEFCSAFLDELDQVFRSLIIMALQAVSPPSAQVVGNAFVEPYYHILHNSPELVYRFYQDSSVLSRPDSNGVMTSVTTMEEMDPTHPYFPDGLNMLNDDFDLSGPAETVAGPSGSGATPTSCTKSKRLTSDLWQCFDVVEMTLPDGTVGPRAKCFYNMKLAESGCPPAQSLTPDDWYVAKIFVEFLQVFYNATVTLSGVYYPTSSQTIHQIVEMSDMLNTYREDDLLGDAVVAMETKFKKY
ncbi:hypothetical protein Dsin_017102 [Dipteronia sinensis]|uniref:NTF2 domain-containing protein n=1 Tax=Dipteronia sinensis TaxID=43782 RepID=A0AAE0AED7_9ROSI|nr:hypothetical protein Dsin_017102 [Dipteronia sinensis]